MNYDIQIIIQAYCLVIFYVYLYIVLIKYLSIDQDIVENV